MIWESFGNLGSQILLGFFVSGGDWVAFVFVFEFNLDLLSKMTGQNLSRTAGDLDCKLLYFFG